MAGNYVFIIVFDKYFVWICETGSGSYHIDNNYYETHLKDVLSKIRVLDNQDKLNRFCSTIISKLAVDYHKQFPLPDKVQYFYSQMNRTVKYNKVINCKIFEQRKYQLYDYGRFGNLNEIHIYKCISNGDIIKNNNDVNINQKENQIGPTDQTYYTPRPSTFDYNNNNPRFANEPVAHNRNQMGPTDQTYFNDPVHTNFDYNNNNPRFANEPVADNRNQMGPTDQTYFNDPVHTNFDWNNSNQRNSIQLVAHNRNSMGPTEQTYFNNPIHTNYDQNKPNPRNKIQSNAHNENQQNDYDSIYSEECSQQYYIDDKGKYYYFN